MAAKVKGPKTEPRRDVKRRPVLETIEGRLLTASIIGAAGEFRLAADAADVSQSHGAGGGGGAGKVVYRDVSFFTKI